jgi:hypothetical protein
VQRLVFDFKCLEYLFKATSNAGFEATQTVAAGVCARVALARRHFAESLSATNLKPTPEHAKRVID